MNFEIPDTPAPDSSSFPRKFFPAPFLMGVTLYCVFIYYLSSMPAFPIVPPFPHFDKLVHFCLFGGLATIVALGMQRAERDYSFGTLLIVPVTFSSLYALSDEVHQLFVEGRSFELGDMAANITGAVAAALLMLSLYRRKIGKKRKREA